MLGKIRHTKDTLGWSSQPAAAAVMCLRTPEAADLETGKRFNSRYIGDQGARGGARM